MKPYYLLVLILTRVCAVFDTDMTCPFETPSIFVMARKVSECTADEIENYFGQRIVELLRKARGLHDAFQHFERSISLARFDDIFPQSQRFDTFLVTMRNVGDIFGKLHEYSIDAGDNESDGVDNLTLTDLAMTVTYQTFQIELSTNKIYEYVTSDTDRSLGSLVKWLAENTIAQDEIVRRTQQSPQQWLYNLYGKAVVAQLKGLVIVQLSYALKIIKGVQIERSRFRNTINEFQKRLSTIIKNVKAASRELSGEYWRFDPKEYKKDENYLEIRKLLQGYLINEASLINRGDSCYGDCERFKKTRIVNCAADKNCLNQRPCSGEVYNCVSLKTKSMNVCLAPLSTRRKYSYIEYNDHTLLGEKTNCSRSITQLDGWIGWCPYCMCLCDDESYSARYISLRRAVSDIDANKVVTGIRFVNKNNLLHLQVQQGELLPYGLINVTTLEWVPVSNFKMYDRYIYNKQDFVTLRWKKNAVDLHVKVVENEIPRRVVTGVRFFVLETQANEHLNLQIRETAFDFPTGKLYPNSSQWTMNLQTEFSSVNPRTKISINNLDVPTRARTENKVKSKGVQYIEFTPTSIEKDAAQTTVPFIDAQDVVPSVPTPLCGVGLYYKAAEGYGGFIGLKIVTYDFSVDL